MNARLVSALVAAALAVAPARARSADADAPLSFAVVPQGPPEQGRARWLPIVERLSAATRLPLRLQLYASAEEFQADLEAGKVDLAYANPVQAIRARRGAGYRPLVRDAALLRGVFFVAADSPYRTVESLAGREVAFIAPWTFCSQSLRAHTRELGIVPRYVGTAANAYKNVLLGLVAAGGLLDSSLSDAPPDVRARLRVIYSTPSMAAHAIIVHPRVPRDAAERVAAAVVALARGEGAGLLAAVHLANPVEAAYGRDYAALEQLLPTEPDLPGRAP